MGIEARNQKPNVRRALAPKVLRTGCLHDHACVHGR